MRRSFHGIVFIVAAGSLAGCATPRLNALEFSEGPEHSLVRIDGTNLLFSEVLWDAGLASEQTVPSGLFGAYMFSVPPGAALGDHPVALRNSEGTSASLNYRVTDPLPFGAPRIDHVTLLGTQFSGADVSTLLYVQGANFDVGAVVEIDGTDVGSGAHKGLRTELFGADPDILGNPIYHYLSLIAIPDDPMPAGDTIDIRVRNLDGQTSDVFSYDLPASAAELDSDGDGLRDDWETAGYDADGDGMLEVDLPALGSDEYRPDIYVEMDVMQGLANPPMAATPTTPSVYDATAQMFAAAPILNPYGDPGVRLVIDASGSIPNTALLHFGAIVAGNGVSTDFAVIRNANFTAARDDIYHYGIWGDALVGNYSGVSDADLNGTGVGDDFLVSFDNFGNSHQTLRAQVETFAHELGHNLSFRHGGLTHRQYNPQYWSAMSYTWQLRSGIGAAGRRNRVTCAPIYWADDMATEPNGAAPAAPNFTTDYSHGMGPTVVENTNSLQEATGVCGPPVDWNNDGDTVDANLNADANDAGGAAETLVDVSNWRGLQYGGPADDGRL